VWMKVSVSPSCVFISRCSEGCWPVESADERIFYNLQEKKNNRDSLSKFPKSSRSVTRLRSLSRARPETDVCFLEKRGDVNSVSFYKSVVINVFLPSRPFSTAQKMSRRADHRRKRSGRTNATVMGVMQQSFRPIMCCPAATQL